MKTYITLATILLSMAVLLLTGCGGEFKGSLSENTNPTTATAARTSLGQP
jgi:outer membrane lipopolysaccharide assembly protein LptE/RlpB